jgi:hypothetical protein
MTKGRVVSGVAFDSMTPVPRPLDHSNQLACLCLCLRQTGPADKSGMQARFIPGRHPGPAPVRYGAGPDQTL